MYGMVFDDLMASELSDETDAASGGLPVAMCLYALMVALADKKGVVRMARGALARVLNFPAETLDRALAVLEDPKIAPEYGVEALDGRGWRVLSYGHEGEIDQRNSNAQNARANAQERARVLRETLREGPRANALLDVDVDVDLDVNHLERDPDRATDDEFRKYCRGVWRCWKANTGSTSGFTTSQKAIVRAWFDGGVKVGFVQAVIDADETDRSFAEYEFKVFDLWKEEQAPKQMSIDDSGDFEKFVWEISNVFRRTIRQDWVMKEKDRRVAKRMFVDRVPLELIVEVIEEYQRTAKKKAFTLRHQLKPIHARWMEIKRLQAPGVLHHRPEEFRETVQ